MKRLSEAEKKHIHNTVDKYLNVNKTTGYIVRYKGDMISINRDMYPTREGIKRALRYILQWRFEDFDSETLNLAVEYVCNNMITVEEIK